MDCLSARQTRRINKAPINKPLFAPEEEIVSALLHRLAEMEQRMFLQRYEIKALEAEIEVLRSETYLI